LAVFETFRAHRTLIFNLARRDVLGRYSGSFLGLLWSFFNPLLMLGVYTYVFGIVFKARWSPNESASILEFAVVLFAGLLVFGIFSECVNRAPSLMLQESGLREARRLSARNHALGRAVARASFTH
jgi:lipopolysaccharide transport system permease protein